MMTLVRAVLVACLLVAAAHGYQLGAPLSRPLQPRAQASPLRMCSDGSDTDGPAEVTPAAADVPAAPAPPAPAPAPAPAPGDLPLPGPVIVLIGSALLGFMPFLKQGIIPKRD